MLIGSKLVSSSLRLLVFVVVGSDGDGDVVLEDSKDIPPVDELVDVSLFVEMEGEIEAALTESDMVDNEDSIVKNATLVCCMKLLLLDTLV